MHLCPDCGNHMSDRYHRVLADRNGHIRCVDCRPTSW